MKYVSLDLETTGLCPFESQILQISMVVDDTEKWGKVAPERLPHKTVFIKPAYIYGEAYALGMNGWILDIISGRVKNPTEYPVVDPNILDCPEPINYGDITVLSCLGFLDEHFGDQKVPVAGKNVAGFDLPFLPTPLRDRFSYRTMDPGMLFFDPVVDTQVPGLAKCLKRAGIDKEVPHDARADALLVIELIRAYYKEVI